ncbi:MAG: D-Ala-D-Ala carboxypeptidase family metallohydrolase, partial [Faecalibacterium prausnitzii]|nr:D-Ala-D-Ala carboxypeptidase family metallohydrolase [Faecalibacterium prausnitzii]
MSIEAYSTLKNGNKRLSEHFEVREFQCRDGSDPVFVDTELVDILEKIRTHFGKPLVITSAYRTAAHNKAVGGAAYSQHCYGRAADIRVPGVPVETLAAYAETLLPDTGGIGRYPAAAH